jgi:hypothetical protein
VPYQLEDWEAEASLNPFKGSATRYMPSVSNKLTALIIFLKIPFIFSDGTKSWNCSLIDKDGNNVPNGYCTRGRGVCINTESLKRDDSGWGAAWIRSFGHLFTFQNLLPSITGKLNAILVHLANHPLNGKVFDFTFYDQSKASHCSLDQGEIGDWDKNKGRGKCNVPIEFLDKNKNKKDRKKKRELRMREN